MKTQLFKRNIIDQILPYIGDDSIIVLHGARQVGKTHILYYIQQNILEPKGESCLYIDLEDGRILETLELGVEQFLNYIKSIGYGVQDFGDKKLYIFIDEIQYLTNPSSFLKQIADHHKNIQLIISGSSSFEIKSKFKDSLVGRTVNFEIFNLSFEEFLVFKGLKYNMETSFDVSNPATNSLKELYNEYMLYGGYPQIVLESEILKKEKKLQQIIQTYIQKDIKDLARISDTKKFNQLIKTLANNNGQLINVSGLSSVTGLSKPTIEKYLFILENTYVLKLVPPFSKNSKTEITKMPKLFFYDTGIVQLLNNKELTQSTNGNLFECSVFAELIKEYGSSCVYYWRTKNDSEVDFVLDHKAGIIPIEVKYNFEQFRSTAITNFVTKYSTINYKVIGLNGNKSKDCIFPWEVVL
jgi:uncharacterized protein